MFDKFPLYVFVVISVREIMENTELGEATHKVLY